MKPGYDEQPRSNDRSWAGSAPLDRARTVALMYRARLRALDTEACNQADQVAVGYGETWMVEKLDIVDPDAEVTTAEAAELVKVPARQIRDWACFDHPERPGEPLLPRFKMRGRERTYLAVNVLAAAAAVRRQRHARTRNTWT
jgi:hypothetical protein